MADETASGNPGDGNAPVEAVRPDALPESYWDPEAKAPKFDALGKDLTEFTTLKTERDARLAAIPKDGKYAFDLPADYKIPDGMKWTVDEGDPLAKGAVEFAKAQGLTQPQFTAMAAMWAQVQLSEHATQTEWLAKETKALGAGAETRRSELKTWLGGKEVAGLSKDQQSALLPLLDSKLGVEALETIKKIVSGVQTSGKPGNGAHEEVVDSEAKALGKLYPSMQAVR